MSKYALKSPHPDLLSGYYPDAILYHSPCTDGISAAAVAANYFMPFGKLKDGSDTIFTYEDLEIEFIPAGYNTYNRHNYQSWVGNFKDKNVVLLDFSFPKDVLLELARHAKSVIIIDHHLTARADMADLVMFWDANDPETGASVYEHNWNTIVDTLNHSTTNILAIFDMNECGASLTYRLLNKGRDLPVAMDLVRGVDLGLNSREDIDPLYKDKLDCFMWWSRGQEMNLPTFMPLFDLSEEQLYASVMAYGRSVDDFWRNKQKMLGNEIVSGVWTDPDTGDEYKYNLAFTDYVFCSQSAMALARTPIPATKNDPSPEIPSFGVVVYFTKTGMGLSLRSEAYFNVARVARSLGGGGHAQAAGANFTADKSALLLANIYGGKLEL